MIKFLFSGEVETWTHDSPVLQIYYRFFKSSAWFQEFVASQAIWNYAYVQDSLAIKRKTINDNEQNDWYPFKKWNLLELAQV